MKQLSYLFVLAAFAAPVALANAASAPARATVVIQHQTMHCHSWSFDHGKSVAAVSGTIARGGTVTFTNNDVMSHTLILKSGPAAIFEGKPLLNHMGQSVTVAFPKAGVYVFGTRAGEDYMKGVVTKGEDNVLRFKLTVR
jgi:plastocyanin